MGASTHKHTHTHKYSQAQTCLPDPQLRGGRLLAPPLLLHWTRTVASTAPVAPQPPPSAAAMRAAAFRRRRSSASTWAPTSGWCWRCVVRIPAVPSAPVAPTPRQLPATCWSPPENQPRTIEEVAGVSDRQGWLARHRNGSKSWSGVSAKRTQAVIRRSAVPRMTLKFHSRRGSHDGLSQSLCTI